MNTVMKLICRGIAVARASVAIADDEFQAKLGKASQGDVVEFSIIVSGGR